MIPMHNTNSIILKNEAIDLPRVPAVYAIFSLNQCRYVGITDNLHEAVKIHFTQNEPNMPLRYFMLSDKTKVLLYEVISYKSSVKCAEKKRHWVTLFGPTDSAVKAAVEAE